MRDEYRVLAGQSVSTVRVGKDDRFRIVFRVHHESVACADRRLRVEPDSELAQYPHGGGMQPFSRQSLGSLGARFEQDNPGASSRMGERTQTADWSPADNRDVVMPGGGDAHWKMLACGRQR